MSMSSGGASSVLRQLFYSALLKELAVLLAVSGVAVLAWEMWRMLQERRILESAGAGSYSSSSRSGSVTASVPKASRPASPAPASSADQPEVEPLGNDPAGRRVLRYGFGALWLLDGLLQAQPAMPGRFATGVLGANLPQPHWLAILIDKGMYAWQLHHVLRGISTVWVQVGIGLGILLGGDGLLGKFALRASLAWGLIVWVIGEALGGMAVRGAGWLPGSPGGVLFYMLAAVLLLVPVSAWQGDKLGRRLLQAVGAFWIAMAFVQALPYEGWWRPGALHSELASAASMLPGVLRSPVSALASASTHGPDVWNAVIVAIMAVIGLGLLSGRKRGLWAGITLGWVVVTWYVGMGLGVFGGVGTDPNSGLPLGLIVVAALLASRPLQVGELAGMQAKSAHQAGYQARRFGGPVRTIASVLGATTFLFGVGAALLAAPAYAATDPATSAILQSGAALFFSPHSVPGFTLTNQYGKKVSLASFRGKAVLLTDLDPLCWSECPLLGAELAQVDRQLGSEAKRVELVAVVANPDLHSVGVLRAFDAELGLDKLANWEYLTGSTAHLRRVWRAYGWYIKAPQFGMVNHPSIMEFLNPSGLEVANLGLSDKFGYQTESGKLDGAYVSLITEILNRVLTTSGPSVRR